MKKKFAASLVLSVFLGSFAMIGSAGATPVSLPATLDKLLPSGTTTSVSNLDFGDFAYTPGSVGSPPAASAIKVSAVTGGGEPGLSFSGKWSVTGAGKVLTSNLDYYVSVAGTKYVFDDAGLSVTGTLPTGAKDKVTEVIYGVVGGVVQTSPIATLTYIGTNDPVTLGGNYKTLYIEETISVTGVKGAPACITDVKNQFSERLSPVPIPPALLLLPGPLRPCRDEEEI